MNLPLCAAQVTQDVLDLGRSLDVGLDNRLPSVDSNLHPYFKELCFGSVREFGYLQGILNSLLKKPVRKKERLLNHLLVVSLYRLGFMRTPDHAVVNQAVSIARKKWGPWAGNLTNAVLRQYLRNQDSLDQDGLTPWDKVAMPRHLYDLIQAEWSDDAAAIFQSSREKPPMTLRVNTLKNSRDQYQKFLQDAGVKYTTCQYSELGLVLDQPMPVTELPGFAEGRVSVQDESAQLVLDLMSLESGQRVLDGCAAPGGKTCLIVETGISFEYLLALDLEDRVPLIEQNIERLGLAQPWLSVQAKSLLELEDNREDTGFNRILLDVPCSGSGVIRRHPDIKHRRQVEDLARFAAQQADLLDKAWSLLAPGGKLLYVTCSLLQQENEDVIEKFITKQSKVVVEELTPFPGIKLKHGYQRLPGVHSGDGFYYCRLSKPTV